MEKRYGIRIFPLVVGIIFISLSCQCGGKKYTKVIKVIFDMDQATTSYKNEGGKKIATAEFKYDPREAITDSLDNAGYKVVSPDDDNYDLVLKIMHRERARFTGRYTGDTSSKTVIEKMGFELHDKDGTLLLEEKRGPFAYEPMIFVKLSFIKDLVELVQIRLEKADETACWLESVSRRGDKASVKAIEKAGNPNYNAREEQLIVLKPIIRSHDFYSRTAAVRLLEELGYTADSFRDSAAFYIVKTYPFHRWSATSGERTPGAWAARQGVISVIKYGTTAIDLFIEDLKGKQTGGVVSKAKAILERLSDERWSEFNYAKFSSIGQNVQYVDRYAKTDFFSVRYFSYNKKLLGEVEVVNPQKASKVYSKVWDQQWNDYTINKLAEILDKGRDASNNSDFLKTGTSNPNYFKDVIEILGQIADNRVIQSIKNYIDHPKLAEDAKKALENIEKREQ